MKQIKTAIFASGTGSNFDAIMDRHDNLGCEVVLLVCDQPKAPVIHKAKNRKIETLIVDAKSFSSRKIYEKKILIRLKELDIDWIFLAGYMRMIGQTLLDVYEGRIVNIHPSLLPEFPGLDAIGQALRAGVRKTGVTIHYIDAGMDTGPIITQEDVQITPEDTLETLQAKIQRVEHKIYPETIKQLMEHSVVTF